MRTFVPDPKPVAPNAPNTVRWTCPLGQPVAPPRGKKPAPKPSAHTPFWK